MGAWALAAAVTLFLAGPAQAIQATISVAGTNLGGGASLGQARPCRQAFRVLPYLTHVTSSAVRVNMIPDASFDLRVSLSPATSQVWGATAIVTQNGATADVRTHLVAAPTATFTGLAAGTQYKYLVECRANATSPYQVVQRAYFRTLQTSGAATVRVLLTADDHTSVVYRQAICTDDLADDGIRYTTDPRTGVRVNRLDFMNLTASNMGSWPADFLVMGGDNAMLDVGSAACDYVRENGETATLTLNVADDQAEQELRWEVVLAQWQPVMAYLPTFFLPGNHEDIWGYGGAGAVQICDVSETLANSALAAYQAMLGNYNDAYDNGSADSDIDGDTIVENQEEGLYFEFASGSLRFFVIDNQRYQSDLDGAAVPASQFAGFVARAADTPVVFGSVPAASGPMNGSDTPEDNVSMGSTQVQWLINRLTAKTEAFGALVSHRVTGGITTETCYYYSRGIITTQDSDMDGTREVTESWDADADGDLPDEHYIEQLMVTEGAQIRFTGHDHFHLICRKNGIHHILLGKPSCLGTGCTQDWYQSFETQLAEGRVGNPTTQQPSERALVDTYDCNEDGRNDADPLLTETPLSPRAVANEGTSGANGTLNSGFGILTVNGATDMNWRWIVTDPADAARNNDAVISYGPITP